MRLLTLLVLATTVCLIRSQYEPVFVILSSLFRANNITYTESISQCLDPLEREVLSSWFNRTIHIKAKANINQLSAMPDSVIAFYKSLGADTQNCLAHNNDARVLLHKFGVDSQSAGRLYSSFIESNHSSVQRSLSKIGRHFDLGQYETIGSHLNEIGHQVFGFAVETQWVKRVQKVQTLSTYYGVSVGNGAMGIISSQRPFTVKQSVLAGAYDKYGRGRVDNIIKTFNGINLEIQVNGNDYSHTNFVQELNMREGSFRGSFTSDAFSAEYDYYALKTLPFASLIKITITPSSNLVLKVTNKLEALDYMHQIQQYFEHLADKEELLSIMTSKAVSSTGKLELFTSSMFLFNENKAMPAVSHIIWDSNMHYTAFQAFIKKGQSFTFAVISCSLANNLHPDPYNQALRVLIRAYSLGIDKLVSQHKSRWNKQWDSADIIIGGNPSDQKDVRMMLYHMYSFINPNTFFGLSPMGLSGTGYNGHVFWDMDLWMYPGILGLDPDLGASLIEYRYQRLDQAIANAYINGYGGAMYPWESASEGTEQTPVWALTGPLQHHITGCVAFAAWNYFAVTQDKSWLSQKGYKILTKAAQFWESRVEEKDGFYHINNVVASDEWAENVDDDAFTNAVAKTSFRLANKAKQVLGHPVNEDWEDIANRIVILKFDDLNVTKEHMTYKGGVIKQADVNLLSFPLKYTVDDGQTRRDLEYYKNKIPDKGTPAMTYSIFTILYSRLNDSVNAYKYFKESYQPYMLPPFGVFAETKGGNNPYFLTGAGGVIQSLVYGFGGLDITDQGLVRIETAIPKEWSSVTIKTKAKVLDQSKVRREPKKSKLGVKPF